MKASDLLDFDNELNESSKNLPAYYKRPVVFVIVPDPFDLKTNINTNLMFGNKAAADSGRKNESPLLCYAFKLGLYNFNQWSVRVAPFSDQQLFDMQASQMLRCNHVAVYGKDITDNMQRLIEVARNRMGRIDFRNI